MPKHSKIETQKVSDNQVTSLNIDTLISKRDVILNEGKKYGIQDVYISKNLGPTMLYFQIDIISATATEEQVDKFKNYIREILKYESEIILLNRKTLAELLNFQIAEQQRELRAVLNSAIPLMELSPDDPLENQLEEEWSDFSNIISNGSLSDEKKIALLEPLYQSDINLIYLKDDSLSALHVATQNCGVEMAECLLQKCPDLIWSGLIDRTGNVLDFAAMNSNIELFDYFLSQDNEKQILLKHKNFAGATLLHYAVMGNRISILKKTIKLLKLDNIDTPDDHACYPIHYAFKNLDNAEMIEYLIKRGARINSKTSKGEYPIHFLAYFNAFNKLQKFSTITLLAKQGIDINLQTSTQHETVLHLLISKLIQIDRKLDDKRKTSQYLCVIEALIQYGLNPFIKNAKNQTALKAIFSKLANMNNISYCNFAYELLHIFARNGVIVENEIFINELSYLKNPIIKFGYLTGEHLKKIFTLLIDFFPSFYCHDILSKTEYNYFLPTVKYSEIGRYLLAPIQNMFENIRILIAGHEAIPDELSEYCKILLTYGFIINVTLSADEIKMVINIGTEYFQAVSTTNPEYLKIISRILIYKMRDIKQQCLDDLKLLFFNSLSKVPMKDCYEISQFLLDHPEAFNSMKLTKAEINELEKNRTNSFRKLYEFPRLTFFAVNKLISANQRFSLSSNQDKITLATQLDVIGKNVLRVRENKQRMLNLFDIEESTPVKLVSNFCLA